MLFFMLIQIIAAFLPDWQLKLHRSFGLHNVQQLIIFILKPYNFVLVSDINLVTELMLAQTTNFSLLASNMTQINKQAQIVSSKHTNKFQEQQIKINLTECHLSSFSEIRQLSVPYQSRQLCIFHSPVRQQITFCR